MEGPNTKPYKLPSDAVWFSQQPAINTLLFVQTNSLTSI